MKHWMIAMFLTLAPLAAQSPEGPQGGERAAEGWRQRVEEAQQKLQSAREQLRRLQQERAGGEGRDDGAWQRPQGDGTDRGGRGPGARGDRGDDRRGDGARSSRAGRGQRDGAHGRHGGQRGSGREGRNGPGVHGDMPPMAERWLRLRALRDRSMGMRSFQGMRPPMRGFDGGRSGPGGPGGRGRPERQGFTRPGGEAPGRGALLERLRQLRKWRAEPEQPMRGPRSGRGRNDV
ncbi:MAG: hypothetical protein ACK6DH_10505 [Planctomycetota bacterium]